MYPITPLLERYQAGQPLNFTVGTMTRRIHPGHVTKRFFTLFMTSNPEIFFHSLPQMKRIAVSSDHPALEFFGFVKRLSASFGQKEHTSHFICMPTLSMAVASIMEFSRTTIVRDSLSRVFSEYGRSSFSSRCTASCMARYPLSHKYAQNGLFCLCCQLINLVHQQHRVVDALVLFVLSAIV